MFLVDILHLLLLIFFVILICRLVADWIKVFARDWKPAGLSRLIIDGIHLVTDPPIKLLGMIFRPVRIFTIRIDLAYLVLFLLVSILLHLTQ